MDQGIFIVLEGIDGCGKSEQAKLLNDWLLAEGHDVLLTAEPTRNRIGKFIREILSGKEEVDPKTLSLLFTADRVEHLNEINSGLDRGRIVISERYYHSTVAYQAAQNVNSDWLLELNSFAREPDLALFIDADPEISAKRTTTDEIFENAEFLQKVRKNYLEFNDMRKIDGNRSIDDVFNDVKKAVSELL